MALNLSKIELTGMEASSMIMYNVSLKKVYKLEKHG